MLFLKAAKNMKRSIKFLSLAFLTLITSGSILFAQNSEKVGRIEGGGPNSYKFIGCQIIEDGNVVVMVGGRCGSGTHACIANPCY